MSGSLFRELLNAGAERAELTLEPSQTDLLEAYFDLLRRWNRTINLTALALDPTTDSAIDRLFIEPLAAARFLRARCLPVPNPESPIPVWFDLGSGGGSPAIPMKIALPELDLTMVESRSRKAAFLSEAARALRLECARVENVRFEDLSSKVRSADLVTSRAVRPDSALESVARRLLRPGGCLAVFGLAPSRQNDFQPVRTVQLVPNIAASRLHISAFVPRGTNPLTPI